MRRKNRLSTRSRVPRPAFLRTASPRNARPVAYTPRMVAARSPNVHDSTDIERDALERECAALRRDQAVLALGLSHDLRTPLRAIESFSYLLQQHGAQLDDQGRDHLRRIRDASARMTRLLSRMQAYLQAGTAAMRIDDVDVSLLAEWCIAELRDAAPDRDANVDIAQGLRAHGDERMLKSALQELLHNAWHFTPADRPVQIRVDAERGGVQALEGFAQAQAERGVEAIAAVVHAHGDERVAALRVDADVHGAIGGRVVPRVVQQFLQRGFQQALVAVDAQILRDVDMRFAIGRGVAQLGDAPFDEQREIDIAGTHRRGRARAR